MPVPKDLVYAYTRQYKGTPYGHNCKSLWFAGHDFTRSFVTSLVECARCLASYGAPSFFTGECARANITSEVKRKKFRIDPRGVLDMYQPRVAKINEDGRWLRRKPGAVAEWDDEHHLISD